MSRIPGAFETGTSSDTDTEASNWLDTDASMDDSQDEDFVPGEDDDDGLTLEEEEDMEEILGDDDASNDAGTQTGGTAAAGGGNTLRIGYDTATRQILVVDAQGRGSRLTAADLRGSTLTMTSLRRMLQARFGGGVTLGSDDDEEEDEEEVESDDGGYWGTPRGKAKQWYELVKDPVPAGQDLERSGDFGPPPHKYAKRKVESQAASLASLLRHRELVSGCVSKATFGDFTVPNSAGTEVSQFQSKVYSGQYSQDGSFFYSAVQDQKVYLYDTRTAPLTGSKSVTDGTTRTRRGYGWEHRSSMKTRMIVKARDHSFRWTTTDANLSPDGEWLVYSSITPRLHLVRTRQGEDWATEDHDQEILDLAGGVPGFGGAGIWSVRFSNDGKELVAGGNTGGSYHGQMFVYDIETRKTILRVKAHTADVNAVAFADKASSNLLLSGSDDSFLKVWDRRSLAGERASGILVGHTEGISFVSPKGDGRYCISNGKDQSVKLWDLRMMMSDTDFDRQRLDRRDFGIPGWDYREAVYRKPQYLKHPHDVSVMTYRGHAVLRTLIRCHFSPIATTNQRYIYSGSSDGRIHIWSLDGRIVQVLDRRNTRGLINSSTGQYNDPSTPDDPTTKARTSGSAVRDVSWHPLQPSIMSTAWGGHNQSEGSLAMHQWKPRVVGEELEDTIGRMEAEAKG